MVSNIHPFCRLKALLCTDVAAMGVHCQGLNMAVSLGDFIYVHH